jgi:hypothetical protein
MERSNIVSVIQIKLIQCISVKLYDASAIAQMTLQIFAIKVAIADSVAFYDFVFGAKIAIAMRAFNNVISGRVALELLCHSIDSCFGASTGSTKRSGCRVASSTRLQAISK